MPIYPHPRWRKIEVPDDLNPALRSAFVHAMQGKDPNDELAPRRVRKVLEETRRRAIRAGLITFRPTDP